MNKKGDSELLGHYLVHFIIILIVIIGVSMFIFQFQNRAVLVEQYYASAIVGMINEAKAGESFTLDVHKASEIAYKNKVQLNKDNLFRIDNDKHELHVKLSKGAETVMPFYNKVKIEDMEIVFAEPVNVLKFKVDEYG